MKPINSVLAFLLIFFSGYIIYGQQGKVDPTFNTFDDGTLGDGFDNTVRALGVQSDGKLVVGGDFLNFNGQVTPFFCRLLSDGSKDLSFNLGSGFNNKIYACALQPDGKILVAGSFTQFNGAAVGRLVRLNSDGSRDTSFVSTPGATNNIIYDMALQSDGSIYLVGSFTSYNGVSSNRIIKLLPNGTVDTSFAIGSAASGLIEKVKIQSDGKVIIGGGFSSFNGVSVSKIARLHPNGSVDMSFDSGLGFDNNVSAIGLQTNGKIILGGSFSNYNGNVANSIVRLNDDGSIDTTFSSGSGFSSGSVESIIVTSNDEIMLGGSFSGTYNGTPVNRVQLLLSNGEVEPNFDIGKGPATATVYTITNLLNSTWFVGGSFSIFDDQNQGKLAKIDTQGVLDIGYLTSGVGLNNSVSKILPLANRSILAVGNFTQFNGVAAPRITKLNENGEMEPQFNGVGLGANATIRNAVLQADGKIVIVGNFTSYNGIEVNRIARLLSNGSIDSSFNIGIGCNGSVYDVKIQSDGKIILVGNFSTFNGLTAEKIVRLLPDGSYDSSFNTGTGAVGGIVETVAIQPDGKLILAGNFTAYNGSVFNRIVRLNNNGSVDTSFLIGSGFNGTVYSVVIQNDGKLVVGGSFSSYNGITSRKIIRLNTDGSIDTSFINGTGFSNGTVRSILVQPNNKILIGGTFSGTYNGIDVKKIVRVNAEGEIDTSFSAQLNSTLFTMALTTDEKLLIGGTFNSVSGITKHRIARLFLCVDQTKRISGLWTNGFPTPGKEVYFENDFTFSSSVEVCTCTVSNGVEVQITSGNTLTIRYQYDGAGQLIFENNSSLIQTSTVANSGCIEYRRISSPMKNFDFTYWSSPVANQNIVALSPNTLSDKYFKYDPINGWILYNNPITSTMTPGVGYIIRVPKPGTIYPNGENWNTPTYAQPVAFKGVPNNGDYSVVVGADQYNLIGNPYPSALDADLFMTANSGIIYGALYFWTHKTAITNNVYTANDYATYTLTGGVGTGIGSSPSGIAAPTRYIGAGQSFFVGNAAAGSFQFTNAMRVAGNNTQFFKQTDTKKTATIEKNRVWLNLTNSQGAFKQMLIGYITGATNEWDNLYDGPTFNGHPFIDFYSVNNGKNFTIQGRALPFETIDEVPLGYRSTIAGTFDISIDSRDGALANQEIWLEDKKNNTVHELSKGKYTFTAINGVENDRFVLKYTNKSLGMFDEAVSDTSIVVSVKNKKITITSPKEMISKVQIFDILGRKVYDNSKINTHEWSNATLVSSDQVLILKIMLANGSVISKKIAF